MDRAKVIEAVEAELRRQDVWVVRSSSASVMVDGWLQLGELADAVIKAQGATEHEKAESDLVSFGSSMLFVGDDGSVKYVSPREMSEELCLELRNASEPSGDDKG